MWTNIPLEAENPSELLQGGGPQSADAWVSRQIRKDPQNFNYTNKSQPWHRLRFAKQHKNVVIHARPIIPLTISNWLFQNGDNLQNISCIHIANVVKLSKLDKFTFRETVCTHHSKILLK